MHSVVGTSLCCVHSMFKNYSKSSYCIKSLAFGEKTLNSKSCSCCRITYSDLQKKNGFQRLADVWEHLTLLNRERVFERSITLLDIQ